MTAAATLMVVSPPSGNAGPRLRFDRPLVLPGADDVTEPSIAVDPRGRIYVSGPTGLASTGSDGPAPLGGVAASNSPAWRSDNDGRSWTRLFPTSLADQRTRLGGGDTDVITDKRGYVYATDLWLGNDSIAVSRDQGRTWSGSPVSHRPGTDRNWLAYSETDDALYQIYDGFDGLWLSRVDLGELSSTGVLLWQDIGQVYAWGDGFHPPGRFTIDRRGCLSIAFVGRAEMQVGRSCDKGTSWRFSVIAKVTDPYYLADIAVDAHGTVALVWGDADTLYFSHSINQGSSFATRKLPAVAPATFPVIDALGVGTWGVAWIENRDGPAWDARFALVSTARTAVTWAVTTAATDVVVGSASAVRSRVVGDFMSAAVAPDGDYYLTLTRKGGNGLSTVVLRLARANWRM